MSTSNAGVPGIDPDQLKAETLRSVLRDVGAPSYLRTVTEMRSFLTDAQRYGLEAAIKTANTSHGQNGPSTSALSHSTKRKGKGAGRSDTEEEGGSAPVPTKRARTKPANESPPPKRLTRGAHSLETLNTPTSPSHVGRPPQLVVEIPPPTAKRGRGRPRKVPPKTSASDDEAHEETISARGASHGAPAVSSSRVSAGAKRGRKPTAPPAQPDDSPRALRTRASASDVLTTPPPSRRTRQHEYDVEAHEEVPVPAASAGGRRGKRKAADVDDPPAVDSTKRTRSVSRQRRTPASRKPAVAAAVAAPAVRARGASRGRKAAPKAVPSPVIKKGRPVSRGRKPAAPRRKQKELAAAAAAERRAHAAQAATGFGGVELRPMSEIVRQRSVAGEPDSTVDAEGETDDETQDVPPTLTIRAPSALPYQPVLFSVLAASEPGENDDYADLDLEEDVTADKAPTQPSNGASSVPSDPTSADVAGEESAVLGDDEAEPELTPGDSNGPTIPAPSSEPVEAFGDVAAQLNGQGPREQPLEPTQYQTTTIVTEDMSVELTIQKSNGDHEVRDERVPEDEDVDELDDELPPGSQASLRPEATVVVEQSEFFTSGPEGTTVVETMTTETSINLPSAPCLEQDEVQPVPSETVSQEEPQQEANDVSRGDELNLNPLDVEEEGVLPGEQPFSQDGDSEPSLSATGGNTPAAAIDMLMNFHGLDPAALQTPMEQTDPLLASETEGELRQESAYEQAKHVHIPSENDPPFPTLEEPATMPEPSNPSSMPLETHMANSSFDILTHVHFAVPPAAASRERSSDEEDPLNLSHGQYSSTQPAMPMSMQL